MNKQNKNLQSCENLDKNENMITIESNIEGAEDYDDDSGNSN